ncbi:cbb3-type cytochrome oxidase assembly protein CcoS [Spirosoma sp.]|uniref:cbb3-type cytochrome oxidase assembly protein CcoS n=1 Tax=Spirosoma sp. TaxID=1899569 RepID=UPI0026225354|nr:cbb3-type cytochrome oxidase assembly protein CcoS [Spirosoma sp.]MCX6217224.1 cbb3-type cytochrome oxidase assembly protein CcoS [Spirosoma sp.]
MSIIFFMIGISLLMALGFLGAFIWSMRTGQQDDLYTPSLRMLLDDELPDEPATLSQTPLTTKPLSRTA